MRKYVLKRILMMLLLLLGMTFIVFSSLYIAPGDPAQMVAGPSASEEDIERIRVALGLDKSFIVQYLSYLKNLLSLDLGTSYTSRQPIMDEILVRLPFTINLACASMLLSVVVGIPLGILSALKKDKLADNIITTGALVGISIPNFLFGVLLMYVFAVKLQILPSGGMTHYFWTPTGFKQAILPAIALASNSIATFIRIGRSSMLDVLQSDYIRTAKSKGLKQRVIVFIHALRNALIPILTQLGTTFGSLLGGAMITEKVFVINGIGTYMIDGITKYNYPVVQSTVLFVAAMFIIINLIVDLVYCVVDPRIRYE
ncbi:MAG: ABC transporter permease [Oscillospiraceae bacterium]|nr:ABC transporter permease [Oscillospiraceae bacterium]